MARVLHRAARPARFFARIERGFLRLVGSNRERGAGLEGLRQDGARLQRPLLGSSSTRSSASRAHLFLNPDHLKGVPSHISLNTAASFVTNTNWQYYGGEYTMSYLTQMAGLAVQNFVSAAVGMAVLAAVVRGLARRSASTLGNFWRDLYRSLVYILLPLAIVVARDPDLAGRAADLPRPRDRDDARRARTQTIARGPVASQIAIKQLGTNGGGFYNSNSAVPFENPNGLHELPRDALDPADPGGAGVHVREDGAARDATRWVVFAAMFAVFAIGVGVNLAGEQHGSRGAARTRASTSRRAAARAAATCPTRRSASASPTRRSGRPRRRDASNGSVNGGLDAQTPAAAPCPLVNIFLGEVIFGGVGSGLYGMFFYIVIAVFVAGPDGRAARPSTWARRSRRARSSSRRVGALFVPTMVLALTALSIVDARPGSRRSSTPAPTASPRRCTPTLAGEQQRQRVRRLRRDELLGRPRRDRHATSAASCRCSPRSRSAARSPRRRSSRPRPGRSAPTAPTFVVLLVGVIVLTAGLMIFPALTLGPIVEGLMH